ncbi:hypothetical protein J132_08479 [Termitomyces sp. J132]|nr:hypothetical protein J132_08479 [Termitomyces sp. J132]
MKLPGQRSRELLLYFISGNLVGVQNSGSYLCLSDSDAMIIPGSRQHLQWSFTGLLRPLGREIYHGSIHL